MTIEFTPDAERKRAAHVAAGHDVGKAIEQQHLGIRYLVAYCECGFEFITRPALRSVS